MHSPNGMPRRIALTEIILRGQPGFFQFNSERRIHPCPEYGQHLFRQILRPRHWRGFIDKTGKNIAVGQWHVAALCQ